MINNIFFSLVFQLINVYAPTKKSSEEGRDNSNDKLDEVVELLSKEDTITILGNFNAQIGNKNT